MRTENIDSLKSLKEAKSQSKFKLLRVQQLIDAEIHYAQQKIETVSRYFPESEHVAQLAHLNLKTNTDHTRPQSIFSSFADKFKRLLIQEVFETFIKQLK